MNIYLGYDVNISYNFITIICSIMFFLKFLKPSLFIFHLHTPACVCPCMHTHNTYTHTRTRKTTTTNFICMKVFVNRVEFIQILAREMEKI